MREERKEEEEEEERARDMHGFLYPRRKLNRRTPILNLLQREKKKKEKKKKGKKHSLHAREFIIDARLFRTAATHGSLVEIRHTRAALLIKNYRPSNS